MRSVDNLPEKERQDGQLVVEGREAGVDGLEGLVGSWEQPGTDVPDKSHVGGRAVVEEDVPGGVAGGCGEEDKGGFCCGEERGHGCLDIYVYIQLNYYYSTTRLSRKRRSP